MLPFQLKQSQFVSVALVKSEVNVRCTGSAMLDRYDLILVTRQLSVSGCYDNNSFRSSPVIFLITLLSALMMASASSRLVD